MEAASIQLSVVEVVFLGFGKGDNGHALERISDR